MSAWYVWRAPGIYPMIPGAPVHVIGSPVFERASIARGAGRFVIEAPGASLAGKYVQSASLNGTELDRTWLTYDAMDAATCFVSRWGQLRPRGPRAVALRRPR